MPNLNSTDKQELNGWQNIGKVIQWVQKTPLGGSDLILYNAIVVKTVGYCQYTSEPLSRKNLSKICSSGEATISRSIKSLLDKKYILRPKSNNSTEQFKSAYCYQLNMKLKDFPSLGKLNSNRDSIISGSKSSKSKGSILTKIKQFRTTDVEHSNESILALYEDCKLEMKRDENNKVISKHYNQAQSMLVDLEKQYKDILINKEF